MTFVRDDRPTRIYFIRPIGEIGPVKIGCSRVPENRLHLMTRWSPQPLEVVHSFDGSFKLEANIHACLADAHIHWEWFRPTPQVVGLVDRLQAGIPIELALDLSNRVGTIRVPRMRGAGGKRFRNSWKTLGIPGSERATA